MPEIPYENAPKSLYFTVIISVFMAIALYLGQGGAIKSGPSPFVTYVLMTLIVIVLGVNESRKRGGDFSTIIEVAGFDQPVRGYNIFLAIASTGVGFIIFQIAKETAQLAPDSATVTSAAFPIYNAYTAFPNEAAITLDFVALGSIALYHFLVVAFNEEVWNTFMSKNIANWLIDNNLILDTGRATLLGMTLGRGIWVTWHYFAWVFTAASIPFGIALGFAFMSPYLLADVTGVITPEKGVTLTKYLTVAGLMSHGTYNTLVTSGGIGLGFSGTLLTGAFLIVIGFAGITIVRNYKAPRILP